MFLDEFKGHCVLDACKKGDIPRLKKFLSSETVNFIHPYSGDTPLHAAAVSIDPKRKQVSLVAIAKSIVLITHMNETVITETVIITVTLFSKTFHCKHSANINTIWSLMK